MDLEMVRFEEKGTRSQIAEKKFGGWPGITKLVLGKWSGLANLASGLLAFWPGTIVAVSCYHSAITLPI